MNSGFSSKRAKGRLGEQIAESYLLNKGYSLLARSYFTPYGELDIVMKDNETIVFVEVKYGWKGRFGAPQEWISKKKKRCMTRAIKSYLYENSLSDKPIRIDCVAIEQLENHRVKLVHIPNAFEATEELWAPEEH